MNIRWHKSAIGAPPRSVPAHGQTRIFPAYVVAKYETDWLLYVEGEKDVLTALSMGLPAFTFTNGSGKLPLDLSLPRQVKKIVLLPDHDESGYTGVGRIARGISAAYQDTEILICRWPDGTSADEDLTSYRELGGTIDNFALKILGDASPPKSTPTPEPRVFELFSPRIDLDRLTPALQEFLSQAAPTTDTPDEFLITAFLTHWAGVVGNKLIGPDRLRPNVWMVLFAGSSEIRKSTAIRVAGCPFKVVQKRFDEGLKEERGEYRADLLRWDSLDKNQKPDVPEPEKPIAHILLLSADFSDAGFYMELKQNPVSGVIVASEFADFHKKLQRDFTNQAEAFLSAYDNERMSRHTRQHGLEVIEEPTFSIMGATTFENFRLVFRASELETGFFQRVFPVAILSPTKERKLFLQRSEMEHDFIQKEASHIKAWLDCPGDLEVVIPSDTTEAFSAWETGFVSGARKFYGERIGPHVERMVPGCLKLAMLCESLEVNDPAGQANLTLSTDSLLCAQMLVENLFLPSVNYLLEEEIVYGRERMNEKRVEKALKAAGGTLDRAALYREVRLSSRDLEEVMTALQGGGLVEVAQQHQERPQGGGKSKIVYTWVGE